MPCVSPALSRQQGAAILLALFTVAIVAMVAGALVAKMGQALDSHAGRHDQAQARLLARGAVDWARNVLAEDARTTSVDHLNEPWTIKVPPTPVEDGEVGGELTDLSGRFNLNGVAPNGRKDEKAIARFARLLTLFNVPPVQADPLARLLADHLQGSPPDTPAEEGARAAAVRLLHPDELFAVPGFEAGLVERLLPHVAALPPDSPLNLNTASAEVLAAVIDGLEIDAARVLVAMREQAWFRDFADFTARLPSSATAPLPAGFAVQSRHVLVHGRARYGVAVVSLEVLLDRQQGWAEIVWQRIR